MMKNITITDKNKKRILAIFLFLLPGMLIYSLLVLYPLIDGFVLSTYKWTTITKKVFVGLENYQKVLTSRAFLKSLKVSLIFMAGTTVLQIGLGFTFGYMLYMQLRGYRVFKSIFFTPVVLMTVAVGFIFNYIFSPVVGLLEPVMELLGLGEHYFPPLASSAWALVIVILTHSWQFLGIQIMMFNTGFMNLPQEVIEMATIDGASGFKMIRYMIIPLTREITKTIIILQMIGSLRAFDVVFVMTGGGPNHATEVLSMHMFVQAFENFKIGFGSVVAVVIFIVCLGLTLISRKIMGQDELQY